MQLAFSNCAFDAVNDVDVLDKEVIDAEFSCLPLITSVVSATVLMLLVNSRGVCRLLVIDADVALTLMMFAVVREASSHESERTFNASIAAVCMAASTGTWRESVVRKLVSTFDARIMLVRQSPYATKDA